MKKFRNYLAILTVVFATGISHAEEKIELETTYLRGNKELPKILFIVPWQDVKQSKHEEQTLVIHSLYGDLFDPLAPDPLAVHKPD